MIFSLIKSAKVLFLYRFTKILEAYVHRTLGQTVGFLKTAKHIIKDGKDQMAPLIESDENRELFRSLVQEIKEIISEDVTETTTG